jgi:hypothetical protein
MVNLVYLWAFANGDLNPGDAVVGVVGDARCHVLCLSVCSFIKSLGLD